VTDEEWQAYHRRLAEYNQQLDWIERYGTAVGPIARPRPPSPPPPARPPEIPVRFAKPPGSGASVRDAEELRRRFCDWRRSTHDPQTQQAFADSLNISSRTLRGYCHDYGLPWGALLRVKCP